MFRNNLTMLICFIGYGDDIYTTIAIFSEGYNGLGSATASITILTQVLDANKKFVLDRLISFTGNWRQQATESAFVQERLKVKTGQTQIDACGGTTWIRRQTLGKELNLIEFSALRLSPRVITDMAILSLPFFDTNLPQLYYLDESKVGRKTLRNWLN